MDKLKQIEAFIAVVEHGSMAAAALTQDVTPVMIGRRINALEARLGVKLLHRSTRRIAVTEQGAVFMEQCKKALGELDRAELLVAEGRHKATGHLIVSAPAAFGRKHVAPHAPDFLRANPDVRCSFNLTDRVVDLVREVKAAGVTIVWIEHIVHALIAVVDRLVVLYGGALIADGEPQAVIKSPRVEEIYMGIAAHA